VAGVSHTVMPLARVTHIMCASCHIQYEPCLDRLLHGGSFRDALSEMCWSAPHGWKCCMASATWAAHVAAARTWWSLLLG
jgi:hypothetical protein